MCDTILASPGSTANGVMLFGKNSDRQRNEAQMVEYFAGTENSPDAQVRCTYITIPQSARTYAVLLCRPFWMWGAEMGANEHGVVIGNQALRTHSPPPAQQALLGMDLLRLALERASTAAEAVEVITALLRQFGQGGNCGHLNPSYYHNGFMIADPREGFVLETVGREWLLERVRNVRAISNRYSIDSFPERLSEGLPELARSWGWHPQTRSSYAEVLANLEREHIGNAGARRACSTALLRAKDGVLEVSDMMRILRDHGSGDGHCTQWRDECVERKTLCMHGGTAERGGQTVGSMISELSPAGPVHWVTASAAPCISIFKPVLMQAPLPSSGPRPTDRFDPEAFWWQHELLHRRAVLGDFGSVLADIEPERDALEADFRNQIAAVLIGGNTADRAEVVAQCWRAAMQTERTWLARLADVPSSRVSDCAVEWDRMNRVAGLDIARVEQSAT